MNEQPETHHSLIDLTKPFIITEKLDGSLISPFWTEGKLRFATKQGVTDTTTFAELFVCSFEAYGLPFRFQRVLFLMFNSVRSGSARDGLLSMNIVRQQGQLSSVTLVWLLVSSLSYLAEESLKLLACRNMITGEYLDYFTMKEEVCLYFGGSLVFKAIKSGIPYTQAWLPEELGIDISDRSNFQSFEKVVKGKVTISFTRS